MLSMAVMLVLPDNLGLNNTALGGGLRPFIDSDVFTDFVSIDLLVRVHFPVVVRKCNSRYLGWVDLPTSVVIVVNNVNRFCDGEGCHFEGVGVFVEVELLDLGVRLKINCYNIHLAGSPVRGWFEGIDMRCEIMRVGNWSVVFSQRQRVDSEIYSLSASHLRVQPLVFLQFLRVVPVIMLGL